MDEVVFNGKIGEVVHTDQKDGRVFERYRSSPAIKLVILSPENKILVTQERRTEATDWIYAYPAVRSATLLKTTEPCLR